MSDRTKGLLNISANFEPQTAEPFDGRLRVKTKNSLVVPATWESSDGNIYTYKGMVVSVYDDEENNGLYFLKEDGYSVASNWKKINISVEEDITYYVDGTDGYDGYDGLSWETAKKTFNFLRKGNGIPRELNAYLTINVRGTVYSTDNIWHFPIVNFYGTGWVIVNGVMSELETGLTVDGYENSSAVWDYHSYITTTGSGWTEGEHKGNFILFSDGYYPILDNTTDTLKTISLPDLDTTDTYKIVSAAIVRGALDTDHGSLIEYLDEGFEIQDCTIPRVNINNIRFQFDGNIDPANWVRIGDRASSVEVHFEKCSFDSMVQILQCSTASFVSCYFDVNNYMMLDTGGSNLVSVTDSVFYAASSTGYGIYMYGEGKCYIGKNRFYQQAIAVNTWFSGFGSYFSSNLFEDCTSAMVLAGGFAQIQNLETGGSVRFRNVGKAISVTGCSLGVFDDVSFVSSNVTTQIWAGDNSTFSFSDIGVNSISNTALGASVYQIGSTTYEPVSINEYSNVSSGLDAYSYQSAIDQIVGIHENTDIDIGTEVIDSFSDILGKAAFWDYVVYNGVNLRAGIIYSCWESSSNNIVYNETSTTDIGDTSAVSLSTDINSNNVRLLATTTTDNWSVKVSRKLL